MGAVSAGRTDGRKACHNRQMSYIDYTRSDDCTPCVQSTTAVYAATCIAQLYTLPEDCSAWSEGHMQRRGVSPSQWGRFVGSPCFGKDLKIFFAGNGAGFLPRDSMLARYMLSSCVRPSVCPSVTSRCLMKNSPSDRSAPRGGLCTCEGIAPIVFATNPSHVRSQRSCLLLLQHKTSD